MNKLPAQDFKIFQNTNRFFVVYPKVPKIVPKQKF